MVELADTRDLKSRALNGHPGSNPGRATTTQNAKYHGNSISYRLEIS